jgi:hypothetical protein
MNQYMLRLKNRNNWVLTWYVNVARYLKQMTKLRCIKKVEDWNVHFKSLGMKLTLD